jgi:hypothetical protein
VGGEDLGVKAVRDLSLPPARLEIDDSYTLIPEDRPVELSRVIQDFVRDTLWLWPHDAADIVTNQVQPM